MKRTFVLITTLFLSYFSYSQACKYGSAEKNVRFGKYNNLLRTNGDMFWNGYESLTGIVNQDNTITPLLFTGGIWMGGKTPTGEVRFSGVAYKSSTDNCDYYPGPLDESGKTKEGDCSNWDKIFQINKSDIKATIDIVYNGKATPDLTKCDKIPVPVKIWPCRGNPYFEEFYGFKLPDQELASFFDYDMDGKYDPCKGDLPTLVTENCDFNSVYEVLTSFPSQMYFNVFNDNGGEQKLSQGNALQMEVQSYFYTFENKDGEDLAFYKFKTFHKGNVPLDSFYFSLWLDPDIGCYEDDYIGVSSKDQMIFAYNVDNIDGSVGSACAGGNPTFGEQIPTVGLSYLQTIKDENGESTGLTGVHITDNCGTGANYFPCDPSDFDINFYPNIKSNKYFMDGNPAITSDSTMCSLNITSGDRRVLLNSGGIKFNPGDSREVVFALSIVNNVPHPCPDSKYIISKNQEAKDLYENCWKTLDGPDAPNVQFTGRESKITLYLDNESDGHNNKNLEYEERIANSSIVDNNKYKFEGYKVFQVNGSNYDLALLGDSNSVEVVTYDIVNDIDSVFNWETIIESDGTRKVVKTLKAVGKNSGIPPEIEIEYDYLNQAPLRANYDYHYVVIAYGYNNYKDYDESTKLGQATQYVSGTNNMRIITIRSKYENTLLTPKIKRISGRGNYNQIEISSSTRENMLSTSFDGTIEYLTGKGPFDIKVIDSTKVAGKIYRIEIDGPIDQNFKVCSFKDDSTYFSITDLSTGLSYQSQNPISSAFDESFDELGVAISLTQPSESSPENIGDNGFIGEKLVYKNDNDVKWFGALKDNVPSGNIFSRVLDPIEIEFNNPNFISRLSSGNFYPFYYSKYSKSEGIPYVTTTNIEAMPVANDPNAGTLKLKDLNNVDIVFTSDKSKWSRCIVVETSNSFLSPLGLSDVKALEVKSNASVDKNGNQESTSTGFSWFPGYAIDVETGHRLNIFFGENTPLSKNPFSLKKPSIANDMLFNPSDELVAQHSFSTLDSFLLGYPVGGGHYIYVTRQAYDECMQLSERLKKGTSAFTKRDPLGAITWVAMPVLKTNAQLLSYENSVIPNDLTISLRANKRFFATRNNKDVTKLRFCEYEDLNPVYEVGFEKLVNSTDNITFANWRFKSSFSGFTIDALDEDLDVLVSDVSGKIISKHELDAHNELEWRATDKGIVNSMIIVKLTSKKFGVSKAYKVVMMR